MPSRQEELFNINGKKIIVVGACGGFGLDISNFLHECGASLFLVDTNKKKLKLLNDSLPGSICLPLDICNEAHMATLLESIKKQFLPLDGAINAAGIFSTEPSIDIKIFSFKKFMDINVSGALLFSQVAAKAMGETGGRIIHLASVSSKVTNAKYAAYSSSKAALSQLVKVLGREWAEKKILVNAVGPAMAKNSMSEKFIKDPQFEKQALSSIPIGRFFTSQDLFGVILLLLGNGGSYITGQTIFVDGGRTLT
jgi:NAD(P)-dependent dehydrogenase (short-subunit alcohol dehydrogenase family)